MYEYQQCCSRILNSDDTSTWAEGGQNACICDFTNKIQHQLCWCLPAQRVLLTSPLRAGIAATAALAVAAAATAQPQQAAFLTSPLMVTVSFLQNKTLPAEGRAKLMHFAETARFRFQARKMSISQACPQDHPACMASPSLCVFLSVLAYPVLCPVRSVAVW